MFGLSVTDGCRYRLAYLFVVVDMVTPQVFMNGYRKNMPILTELCI